MSPRHRRAVALGLGLVLAASACSGGARGERACGPVEKVRAQYPATHLLPGQPEPRYLSEPPTSGPHVAVVSVPTEVDEPLPRPLQVGLLELGLVLLQYRPDRLAPEDVARLDQLAGPRVVVAPLPGLDDAVVATAWLRLQGCRSLDTEALLDFVAEQAEQVPGGHVGG